MPAKYPVKSRVPGVRALVLLGVIAAATRVDAEPRNIYVMPIDGHVDAATRDRLDASLQSLAHTLGTVTTASATFAETASMVGCDPAAAACARTVLATLQADEIVWGTATTNAEGETSLVVHRATKGERPREATTTIAPNESADKVESNMRPFFGGAPASASGGAASVAATTAGAATGSAPDTASSPGPEAGTTTSSGPTTNASVATGPDTPATPRAGMSSVNWSGDKKRGIGLAIGGGAALLIGFALWASESSVQSQINAAPTNTLADISALKALESTANGYAWAGNVMVIIGAVAGGAATYYLWKDHKAHVTTVSAAPLDHGTGGALVLGGRW